MSKKKKGMMDINSVVGLSIKVQTAVGVTLS